MGTRPKTLKGKCQCTPYRIWHFSRRAWCIEQEAEFIKLTSVFPCRRIHNPLVLYTRLLRNSKQTCESKIPHLFDLREFSQTYKIGCKTTNEIYLNYFLHENTYFRWWYPLCLDRRGYKDLYLLCWPKHVVRRKNKKMKDRVSHKINFTNIREQYIYILTPAKYIFRWFHFMNIITYAST
jgi:hypothetical protein